MQNQQLSDVKGKELVAAGHAFAKAIGMDTPLIEIAKMVSELAARLDCALVRGDELEKQRDAQAAENAALKLVLEPKEISNEIQDLFNDTVKLDGDSDGCHQWSWVDNPDEVIIAVMNAMPKPETPAIDAYLNSVRADAVASFAHHQRVIADSETDPTIQRGHRITACRAEDFAAQLRAGKDGE